MQRADDERSAGYVPLRSYAAVGDGRTLALIARDGGMDWLCAPEFDGASVFGRALDEHRGGTATLRPHDPFAVERRYLDDTNVLETTFATAGGRVRVTDAMATGPRSGDGFRTILRRVECLAGSVRLTWSCTPRFGYGRHHPVISAGDGVVRMAGDGLIMRVHAWGLGTPVVDDAGLRGNHTMEAGERGLLAFVIGDDEPPDRGRDPFEIELDETTLWWRAWTRGLSYDGPWRTAVVRSGLALKLLTSAASGAIVAAGTTSLPEVPGGVRNWDYRYSWVRDALLVLDAFFALGRDSEATAYFEWLRARLHAASGEVSVLYDLSGGPCAQERELDLDGWRGSHPVRVGNAAADQFQLSTYGTLLHACHLYVDRAHGGLPESQERAILRSASLLARRWAEPDAGIWEERGRFQQHTHSKMMAAIGLHCAADLARRDGARRELGELLGAAASQAAAFVEEKCADPATGVYTRVARGSSCDASVLMPLGMGYGRWAAPGRVKRTIAAIREHLGGGGSLLYRYRDDDGLPGDEGFFTPCSFWLAGALANVGRGDQAAAVLDDLVPLANDVGLYSEELGTGSEFLGNLPQALTHASLVSAAAAIGEEADGRPSAGCRPWRPVR